MKITLLFLLIALIAITTLVKAQVDEDFDLEDPETGKDRELGYWYNYYPRSSWYKKKKKSSGGKLYTHACALILRVFVTRIEHESSTLLARRFGGEDSEYVLLTFISSSHCCFAKTRTFHFHC